MDGPVEQHCADHATVLAHVEAPPRRPQVAGLEAQLRRARAELAELLGVRRTVGLTDEPCPC